MKKEPLPTLSYGEGSMYYNSPIHFLPNMPEDHPWLDLYRSGTIIFCCGQGAWEDQMRVDSAALDQILRDKNVPHWADFWGYDVNHDWPWWQNSCLTSWAIFWVPPDDPDI